MSTITLSAANFEHTIAEPAAASSRIVFVDFWASWCGPCRQFAPTCEAASEPHPDIVFGTVDAEAEQDLAAAADITSIPTPMAFKEGALVFAQPGALPAAVLEDVIGQVRELDIEQLRASATQEVGAGNEGRAL